MPGSIMAIPVRALMQIDNRVVVGRVEIISNSKEKGLCSPRSSLRIYALIKRPRGYQENFSSNFEMVKTSEYSSRLKSN